MIKLWLESRVKDLAEIEERGHLPPATLELVSALIRHGKGIITAINRWLERVGK